MSLGAADPCLETTRELRRVAAGEQPLDLTLNKIVVAIANSLETDVGSLYLVKHESNSLVLAATVGLLQSCVGNLQMELHEGLVGLVAQQQSPVVLAHAPQHPRFKYFPEADEDEYQSFLGVPILFQGRPGGVLVVQTIEPRTFSMAETAQLTRIARLVAPLLARL